MESERRKRIEPCWPFLLVISRALIGRLTHRLILPVRKARTNHSPEIAVEFARIGLAECISHRIYTPSTTLASQEYQVPALLILVGGQRRAIGVMWRAIGR